MRTPTKPTTGSIDLVLCRIAAAMLLVIAVLIAGAGCGGGGGSTTVVVTGGTPSTGAGTFKTLTIATHAVNPTTPDNETFVPTATAGTISFRLVNAASSYQGSPPGSFGAQADETYGAVAVGAFYLGAFELTQAQWTALVDAGNAAAPAALRLPWTLVLPGSETPATSANLPATGMSYNQVIQVLVAFNTAAAKNLLRLPTNGEWEHACRAASTARYSWGELEDTTTAGTYAWVRETEVAAAIVPSVLQNVGGKTPNAFGFFDMHGNAWEWVDSGSSPTAAIMRGGSCSDNLLSARAANKQYLDPRPGYALAGVRLVLTP